jgi:integrase/recombinase XerD
VAFLLKRLIEWNKEINDEAFYIFLSSRTGERLKEDDFRDRLNKYKKEAGINKDVTPHILRHFFCVDFLRNGGDTRSMMDIIGQSTLTAAEKYTRFNTSILREKKAKHSPLRIKE